MPDFLNSTQFRNCLKRRLFRLKGVRYNLEYHMCAVFPLQIENLLTSSKGTIKLCDFGSATTTALYPDESWTAIQRSMAEDEVSHQLHLIPNLKANLRFALYLWSFLCLMVFFKMTSNRQQSNFNPISCHWSLYIPPENMKTWFFDVFRGYRKIPVVLDELNRDSSETVLSLFM